MYNVFRRQGKVNHCRIRSKQERGQTKFYLIDSKCFDSLYSLITHYRSSPLRSQVSQQLTRSTQSTIQQFTQGDPLSYYYLLGFGNPRSYFRFRTSSATIAGSNSSATVMKDACDDNILIIDKHTRLKNVNVCFYCCTNKLQLSKRRFLNVLKCFNKCVKF